MIQQVKTIVSLTLALMLVLPAFSAVAAEKNDETEAVAKVNGISILQRDLNTEQARYQQVLRQRGQTPGQNDLVKLRKLALESLIEQELLHQAARKAGLEVDEAALDEQMSKLRGRFSDEEAYKQALSQLNHTPKTLKADLAKAMLIQKYVDQEFVQKSSVSDEEIKTYYQEHQDMFKQPEMVKASHILIMVDPKADDQTKQEAKDKLEQVRKEALNQADFAELAKEHSQCPSKDKGGDLGFFSRTQMVEPFSKAAFALKPGEISEIVETRFGYHLIKVSERKDESVASLEEVGAKIAAFLKQEKLKKSLGQCLKELKEKATVEILVPELKEKPTG